MIRVFDILFSSLALAVLSPLLVPIVILLRLTGEGEIFFLQDRIGLKGQTFKLIKFATMLKNSPNIGAGTITVKGDARVLPVGRFLRKTKINELPQLLNIFFGDMSVIGPRPLTPNIFEVYDPDIQKTISKVRPGLSGIGSVVFREEEEIMQGSRGTVEFYETVIAPYKGHLEKWFVMRRSLVNYFTLIGLTCWAVFFPKTSLVWKIYGDLPSPPDELKQSLNYLNRS